MQSVRPELEVAVVSDFVAPFAILVVENVFVVSLRRMEMGEERRRRRLKDYSTCRFRKMFDLYWKSFIKGVSVDDPEGQICPLRRSQFTEEYLSLRGQNVFSPDV